MGCIIFLVVLLGTFLLWVSLSILAWILLTLVSTGVLAPEAVAVASAVSLSLSGASVSELRAPLSGLLVLTLLASDFSGSSGFGSRLSAFFTLFPLLGSEGLLLGLQVLVSSSLVFEVEAAFRILPC